MNWHKAEFEKQQRDDFLIVLVPMPFIEDEYDAATQQITQELSGGRPYVEYVNELLGACTHMIDEEFTRVYCERVLESWRDEISSRIIFEVEKIERKTSESSMPAMVIKRESKTIKPEIQKWIRAYESLRRLQSFQLIPEASVRSSCMTVPDSALHGLGPVLSSDVHEDFFRRAKDPHNHARVTALNRSYRNEKGDCVVDNFIRIEIPTIHIDYMNSAEVDLKTYTQVCALETMEDLIVREATEKYGVPGEIVSKYLLGRQTLGDQTATSPTEKKPRGRPSNYFVNRLILDMDARRISKLKIRLLVDALKGGMKKMDAVTSEEATWDVKGHKYRKRANVNAEKSIAKQIRGLGGNLLRYLADETVKRHRQCEKCDWRWNQQGELIRAIPCARHKGSQDGSVIDSIPRSTLDELTSHRGRAHFANALTEFMEGKAPS